MSDYLAEGVDLTGIDVLETDRRFMRQARKEVEAQGQKMLEQGLDTQVGGHMAGHVTDTHISVTWLPDRVSPVLSTSSLHCLAGLPCRLSLLYRLQVVTREVYWSSLRRSVYPAQGHFIFLTLLIIILYIFYFQKSYIFISKVIFLYQKSSIFVSKVIYFCIKSHLFLYQKSSIFYQKSSIFYQKFYQKSSIFYQKS